MQFSLSMMVFITANLALSSPVNATNIAITIDDYPLPNSSVFTVKERTKRFVEALDKYNAKAAFFCVGQHCNDRNDYSIFKLLQEHGHFIANHSMNHRRLSAISIDEFEKEITQTEDILSRYSVVCKWFRYPYLDYAHIASLGGSKEKLVASFESLNKLGYTEGYVTINTFDWYINKRLQEAIKQKKVIDYEKLRMLYISLLKEWIAYYIDLYQEIIGHEIVHTILLHDNDLNALYLPDVLTMINDQGWNIVSPELAFKDTSWRKQLFNKIELTKEKPASLNTNQLDKLLTDLNVIRDHNSVHSLPGFANFFLKIKIFLYNVASYICSLFYL